MDVLNEVGQSDDINAHPVKNADVFEEKSIGGDWILEIDPNDVSSEILNDDASNSLNLLDETPLYESDFSGFLTEKEYSMETGKHVPNDTEPEAPKRVCFNCLGDHNLPECTEKKDFKKISENRRAFLMKRNGKFGRNLRYHEEDDNIFSSFKPGVFSDSLQDALGLRSNETPELIYRMRVLGYPPGWLKDAEVKRSEVNLIDGTGTTVNHPEDEEGEMETNRVRYEPEKLLSFPGFNVPLSSNHRDDHQYYGCPPMQKNHRREEFRRFMMLNRAQKYKKKKLKTPQTPISDSKVEIKKSTNGDSLEKNIDDKCSEETVPQVPSDHVSPTSQDTNEDHSPLTGNSVSDSTVPSSGNGCPFSTPTSAVISRKKLQNRSQSKGSSLGLFIPDSITPHKDLPTPDQWSVDVTDHLLFENLPDALGTWNRMKGIVNKVRTSLDQLHDANNDSD